MNMIRRIYTKGVFQMTPEGMHALPEESESFLYKGPVAEAISYLYTPPFGVAGDISRPHAPYVAETQPLNPSLPFASFGLPGKMVGGYFVPITTTGDAVYGFLLRVYPSQGPSASDPLGTAVPPTAGPGSVFRKGYVNVLNRSGVPAFGGAVYIRFQNPTGIKIVGGIEAAATGDTYALTGAQFMGGPDADGNVEISLGSTTV